jgi:CubicO group peptidase (beta-lactamase class C family)
MNRLKGCLLVFICLSVVSISGAQTPSFVQDSLDKYINRYMTAFQIPGLAITVIKDGKVVVEKGYGVVEPDGKKVDEHTLFMIASNSKLFTGTSLAMLQEEGKLNIDDKVSKYLPDFRLFEPTSSDLVTIRDVVSHRLGTTTFQNDFTFWNSTLTRKEIVARMSQMKPAGPFRQNYGYCNAGYVVAGEVILATSGQLWEDYVTTQILKPIGMNDSYALGESAPGQKNMAQPFTTVFGALKSIPFDKIDNLGPATSMLSSAHDMGLWMQCQLDSGKVNGTSVIPWKALRLTRQGNTIAGTTKHPVLPRHFNVYGLGVFNSDYNGYQVYNHTGGAFGYVTGACFVPEAKLGIVILTNNDNQSFFETLRYMILDAYLGVRYQDRSASLLVAQLEGDSAALSQQERLVYREFSKDSIPNFAGSFANDFYGKIEITKNNEIRFEHHPDLIGKIVPHPDGKMTLSYNHPGYGSFEMDYKMNEKRQVTQLHIKVNDFLEYESYNFVRSK